MSTMLGLVYCDIYSYSYYISCLTTVVSYSYMTRLRYIWVNTNTSLSTIQVWLQVTQNFLPYANMIMFMWSNVSKAFERSKNTGTWYLPEFNEHNTFSNNSVTASMALKLFRKQNWCLFSSLSSLKKYVEKPIVS